MVIIIDLQILQYKMAFPYLLFHHKIYMLDLYGQLYSTTRLTYWLYLIQTVAIPRGTH